MRLLRDMGIGDLAIGRLKDKKQLPNKKTQNKIHRFFAFKSQKLRSE